MPPVLLQDLGQHAGRDLAAAAAAVRKRGEAGLGGVAVARFSGAFIDGSPAVRGSKLEQARARSRAGSNSGARSAHCARRRASKARRRRGAALATQRRPAPRRRRARSSRRSRRRACRRCRGCASASTGVPLRTASMTTLAPPSMRAGVHQHVRALDALRASARAAARRASGSAGSALRWPRASSPSAASSAAPMWSMRMSCRSAQQARRVEQRLRVFLVAQVADHHARADAARSCAAAARARRRLEDDARLGAQRCAGSAAAPSSCSTTRRCATRSERCAAASTSMSRYRSVPVSTTTSGRPGCAAPRRAIESAERRACRAASARRPCACRPATAAMLARR